MSALRPSRLVWRSKAAKDDPSAWLAMDDIYGDVGKSPVFAEAFTRRLNALWRHGAKDSLARYLV